MTKHITLQITVAFWEFTCQVPSVFLNEERETMYLLAKFVQLRKWLNWNLKPSLTTKLKSLTSMLYINMKYEMFKKQNQVLEIVDRQSANTANKKQRSAKRSSFSWCLSELVWGRGHNWVLRSVLNREFKLTVTT